MEEACFYARDININSGVWFNKRTCKIQFQYLINRDPGTASSHVCNNYYSALGSQPLVHNLQHAAESYSSRCIVGQSIEHSCFPEKFQQKIIPLWPNHSGVVKNQFSADELMVRSDQKDESECLSSLIAGEELAVGLHFYCEILNSIRTQMGPSGCSISNFQNMQHLKISHKDSFLLRAGLATCNRKIKIKRRTENKQFLI